MSIQTFELSGLLDECDLALLDVSISCFDLEQDKLFLGTCNGQVLQFTIATNSRKSAVFSTEHVSTTKISNSSKVESIICSLPLSVIICVCEEQLTFLQSDILQALSSISGKIKAVTCIALNENPVTRSESFGLEFAVGTNRKSVQLYHLSADYKVTLLKQVSVSEIPVAMAVDSWAVIFASYNAYFVNDIKNGTSTMLFPYQKGSIIRPFVKRIGLGEFILNGPNALGVFANSQGVSQNPPLTWSRSTFAVAFAYPYILALDEEFLTVHSILDQIQKQSIPSPGWSLLKDTNNKVVVGSNRDLLVCLLLTEQQQINSLLSENRIDEALVVLSNCRANDSSASDEDFFAFKRKTEQKCAFYKLKHGEFTEAKRLFISSDLPIETLFGMWPSLLEDPSRFVCKNVNIDQILSEKMSAFADYADFFIAMVMHYIKSDSVYSESLNACAEILINLYCKTDSVKLLELIEQNFFLPFDGVLVVELLKKHNQWHSASMHLVTIFLEGDALKIWIDLIEEMIEDPLFPGLTFVVDRIRNFQSADIVLKALHWLCKRENEDRALPIAIERSNNSDNEHVFYPSNIATDFDQYPNFVLKFLEAVYLKCDYNVNLILCKRFFRYLSPDSNVENLEIKDRFKIFLEKSTALNLTEALELLRTGDGFEQEMLILLRRLKLHDEALTMILKDYDLTEFEEAVSYCEKVFADSGQKLFEDLLERLKSNKMFCLDLIKRHGNKISPSKTLQYIPDEFRLKEANTHVTKALKCRASSNSSRNLQHMAALQVARKYRLKEFEVTQSLGRICIDDNSICSVCKGPFFETSFVLLPKECANTTSIGPLIVHVSCLTESVLKRSHIEEN